MEAIASTDTRSPGAVTVPGKPGGDLPPRSGHHHETVRAEAVNEFIKYTVVIEKAPCNYAAFVPDLPGCVATGATRKAVLEEIREAISFHIESLRAHGEPVPEPQSTAEVVEIGAATAK